MITLKTLPEATAQQVFDQVVNHLRAQGKQSIHDGKCLYRHPRGLQCAAGCLIGDDEYKAEFDYGTGSTWQALIDRGVIQTSAHKEMIKDLQNVHDFGETSTWEDRLKSLAERFQLEYKPSQEK